MSSSTTNKSPAAATPTTKTPSNTLSLPPPLPDPRCPIYRPEDSVKPVEIIIASPMPSHRTPEDSVKPVEIIIAPPMPSNRTPEEELPELNDYFAEYGVLGPEVMCWTGRAHSAAPAPNATHHLHSSAPQENPIVIRSTGVPAKIQSGIPGPTPVPLNIAVVGKPVVHRVTPAVTKE